MLRSCVYLHSFLLFFVCSQCLTESLLVLNRHRSLFNCKPPTERVTVACSKRELSSIRIIVSVS